MWRLMKKDNFNHAMVNPLQSGAESIYQTKKKQTNKHPEGPTR